MSMKRSKISDVAGLVGVSKSTISNYLNGRYGNMSPETRKKIAQTIKDLNYTPNISARRLSSKIQCNVICIVIPIELSETFDTLYYPTVLSALGKMSLLLGYDTLIYARGDSERRLAYLKGMASTLVDGFILFDLRSDSQYFREFQKSSIPYVCVGKYHKFNDYNYVASDHGRAIEEAIEYLIALGHAKIGLIQEDNRSVVAEIREYHYKQTLFRYGLLPNLDYVTYISTTGSGIDEQNYRSCEKILLLEDRPTALLFPAGTLSLLEKIAAENNISIPKQLSVVALDYMEGYNLKLQNYTRIDSLAGRVSEIALTKLIDFISFDKKSFHSEIIPLCLIRGDTTVPPDES